MRVYVGQYAYLFRRYHYMDINIFQIQGATYVTNCFVPNRVLWLTLYTGHGRQLTFALYKDSLKFDTDDVNYIQRQ